MMTQPNRVQLATCAECEVADAEFVIGREGWCAQCAPMFETCTGCGEWVRVDEMVSDADLNAYHDACFGPDEPDYQENTDV